VPRRQIRAAARETFNNWLATRRATQQADQDPELIARTKALDALKDRPSAQLGLAVEAQHQAALDAQPGRGTRARRELEPSMESDAQRQAQRRIQAQG
jgi:hypothetical protein